jgi:hypothetical protein
LVDLSFSGPGWLSFVQRTLIACGIRARRSLETCFGRFSGWSQIEAHLMELQQFHHAFVGLLPDQLGEHQRHSPKPRADDPTKGALLQQLREHRM